MVLEYWNYRPTRTHTLPFCAVQRDRDTIPADRFADFSLSSFAIRSVAASSRTSSAVREAGEYR